MLTKETRWSYIKELFNDEEYKICLYESEKFFEELKKNPDDLYNWKVKFEVALCLKKIGSIRQAMSCAKSSLQYAISDSDKTQVFWMLGCCYMNINKQKSIKYYECAVLNYERLRLYDYVYALRFNIAKALNNIEGMESNLNMIDAKTNSSMKNQGAIELFNLYIAKNMTTKAIQLINKTKDKKTRNVMVTTMQQQNLLVVCVE
jgi:tetratricopeptide (TPR) repeat protein